MDLRDWQETLCAYSIQLIGPPGFQENLLVLIVRRDGLLLCLA